MVITVFLSPSDSCRNKPITSSFPCRKEVLMLMTLRRILELDLISNIHLHCNNVLNVSYIAGSPLPIMPAHDLECISMTLRRMRGARFDIRA